MMCMVRSDLYCLVDSPPGWTDRLSITGLRCLN
jgi:hypothetical protein